MKSALYKSNFRFNALDASKLVQLDSSSCYSNSILQLQRDGITSSAFAMMEVHTPRIDPPPRKSPTAYKHSESIALRYQLGSAGNEVITHVLPRRSILLDTGAQASSTGFEGIPGTQRRPDGTLGRPLQLVGGVGRPARVQAIQCVRVRDPESGFVFDIPDDCKAPDWSTAVISAGALESRGVRIGLDGDPRLVFPSGHVVKLHKRRHLYLLDLENVSLTGATPTVSRATMVAAKTLEEPLIEVFEPFAGIGTFSRALRKHGAKIIALLEHSEPPRRYLRAEFPGTLLLGEYRMREWTTQVNWTKGAIRLMVTGAICTPFAPNGKMLGLEDHRNAEVFGVVALAHACRPHVIVLENVYNMFKCGALEVIQNHLTGYHIAKPKDVSKVEFFRSTDHHSAVWRDRITVTFIRDDLPSFQLPPLPTSTVYDKPQKLESFLEPIERVPEDAVVHGNIRMLATPLQLSVGDPRSPRQVAVLEIEASSPIIVGSVVRIGNRAGQYIVEKFYEDGNVKVLLDDRQRPSRAVVTRTEIVEHCPQSLPVFDMSTAISPRRWGQGHIGATNLILRKPGLVTRILPIEIARAMGIDRSHGVSDAALQSIAGNAVTNVMADSVAKRTIQVCKVISDSVQLSGGVVAPATDGVPTAPAYSFLRSAPASAPLQRLSAGESRSQDMCENVPRDANTLSAIFGYCSSDSLRATAKHYGVRILANSTLDETIRKAANCPEAPTMHVTRLRRARGKRDRRSVCPLRREPGQCHDCS